MRRISLPLDRSAIDGLTAGDMVLLSGPVYTARDAAHARFAELITSGQPLPIDLAGATLYYTGPTPARPGKAVGAAGPTTSARMDPYTPLLLERGLCSMIGKGARDPSVISLLARFHAVYFVATGGAGAVLSEHISAAEVVAFEELGTEAVRRMVFADFPVIVACDARGGNLFVDGPRRYAI